MNYPEGFTSRDYDYVDGAVYAPAAPKSERLTFEDGTIHFDYTVLPDGPYGDFEVRVEVCGMTGAYDDIRGVIDFEHVRTFTDADAAQDWVYSFDSFELNYNKVKEAIKRGE